MLRLLSAERAISWCEREDSKTGPILFFKGLCLLQKRSHDKAVDCLNGALELGYDRTSVRLLRAQCFYHQSESLNDDVVAEANAIVAKDPSAHNAHWILSLYYYGCGKYDQALAAGCKATGATTSMELPVNLDDYHCGSHMAVFLESVPNLEVFLDGLLLPWTAHFWIAKRLAEGAKYSEALERYAKALKLCPQLQTEFRSACHNNRCDSFLKIGDYESALLESVLAVRSNPSDIVAVRNRGLAYLSVGRYEDAVEDFTACIVEKSNDYQALLNRGICYLQLNRLKDALTDLTLVLDDLPTNFFALFSRAITYVRKGDFVRAINDLNKFLDLNPDCIAGYKLRGQVLRYLSQLDLIRAQEIDTTQDDCLLQLSSSLPRPYSIDPEALRELFEFVTKLGNQFGDHQHKK